MYESSNPIRKELLVFGRIVFCLSLVIPPTLAKEVVGSISFASCSFFESHLLRLVGFKTDGAEREIELKIPSESVIEREKDWIEVPATVACAKSAPCPIFGRGKIRIIRASHRLKGKLKSISGAFVVTFNDGRKIEGHFTAKYIKPATRIVCE